MHSAASRLFRLGMPCLIAWFAVPAASQTPAADPARPEVYEEFRGQHRPRAKTEYVMKDGQLAPVEHFDDLEAFRAFLSPQTDQVMRTRYPHLRKATTDATQRVAEERHNVSVIAYIHAVKHESGPDGDNDYHVILGSSPTPDAGLFLTAEASGLPPDGPHRDLFAQARQELLSIVGHCHCNGHFRRVLPPIRVRVTGSLFIDSIQSVGAVGPKYAEPFTVWEIHPILSIERLDGGANQAASPVGTNHGSGNPDVDEPVSIVANVIAALVANESHAHLFRQM